MNLRDQERYNLFQVPLSVSYNPGSIIVYQNTDPAKTPLMTVFRDGRVTIRESDMRLEYTSRDGHVVLVLTEVATGNQVAELEYFVDGSYIIR